jgi:hypothetical protein
MSSRTRCGGCGSPASHGVGLAFAYPDGHQALFGVDLTVARGERVALLGPNGAGKTTLVLHLNGILTAAPGRSTVAGLPVGKRHLAEIRRRVGIVFQDPDDQLFMPTVREDVAFGPGQPRAAGAELEPGARRWSWSAWRTSRPSAAPPVLRPAPPGRGGHRAGDGAGDPGPRRAVVQPRPGLPPRAGRHPAVAGRDGADGHPRPAVRPGAVPARGDPQRRRDRGGRPTGDCSPTTT